MENMFETREEASNAAASHVSSALERRLGLQPEASVVVNGRTASVQCLQELAKMPLDWQRVHVLLSDERWVPAGSDESNEMLVRKNLLQGNAADARLHPVHSEPFNIDERCELLEETILTLPFPFGCALLGMGEDGHFASLFADAENLEKGMDVESAHLCLPVQTAASPLARITLTLAALSRSDSIALLFFGEAKRDVYERAKQDANGFPVSRLLLQKRAPVHVFWAP